MHTDSVTPCDAWRGLNLKVWVQARDQHWPFLFTSKYLWLNLKFGRIELLSSVKNFDKNDCNFVSIQVYKYSSITKLNLFFLLLM